MYFLLVTKKYVKSKLHCSMSCTRYQYNTVVHTVHTVLPVLRLSWYYTIPVLPPLST